MFVFDRDISAYLMETFRADCWSHLISNMLQEQKEDAGKSGHCPPLAIRRALGIIQVRRATLAAT